MNTTPHAEDRLKSYRVRYLREMEEMLDLQKRCGSEDDRAGAKFFKEEVADRRKWYRAACLLIPHYSASWPGDCAYRPRKNFPLELWPMVNHLEQMALL